MTTRKRMTALLPILLALAAVPGHAQCQDPSVEAETNADNRIVHRGLVETYFLRYDAIRHRGSTLADIDRLMELMHESVKYQHFEYGADFDREAWRAAFARNHARGAYSAEPSERTRVMHVMDGQNAIAIEYQYGDVDAEGSWIPRDAERLFAVFEFTDCKISLVKEYW